MSQVDISPEAAYHTSPVAAARDTEPLKSVVSNGIWEILSWHVWGVISVSVSIVLIGLNLTQFVLDGEIGRDADETANIIAALQLLIQMHGLSVTASLFQIARQWIHRSLLSLDQGIPLALVGAEREVGSPLFVISHSYLATVKYAASLWWGPQTQDDMARKWDISLVTAFLFVSCIVSVLAAPASGALMIPRVFWFFDSTIDSSKINPPHEVDRYNTFPHLIIPPQEGQGSYAYSTQDRTLESDPLRTLLYDNALDYWRDFHGNFPVFVQTKEALTVHYLSTPLGMKYINMTTTWGRSLDDDTGIGRTYAKSVMDSDVIMAKLALSATSTETESPAVADYDKAIRRWSQRLYVMPDATAIVAQVNCRYRPKILCPSTVDSRIAPWCLEGSATSNRSLILLSQVIKNVAVLNVTGQDDYRAVIVSRAYITEGQRSETHPRFVDTLQVVFDISTLPWERSSDFGDDTSGMNVSLPSTQVIVCSISTVLTPALLSSLNLHMDGKEVDCAYRLNRTIQYHDHWLDHSGTFDAKRPYTDIFADNTTFGPRSMVELVTNPNLRLLGNAVNTVSDWVATGEPSEPTWLEIKVAGAFVTLFSRLGLSTSQYSISPNVQLPEFAEPRVLSPRDKRIIINVYNQGYGFRLSSKVGILAVAVLGLHAVIVLAGSVWQLFWQRSIIKAWNTVPEYLALGLGSTPEDGVLDNTCAGIKAGGSLRTIVSVGMTTPAHLELQVGRIDMEPVLGRFEAKYGSREKAVAETAVE